ncbi:MAG TPA: DUF2141 domain-containing protein [Reyranella sp.]|jgi:uncharacterized protein (DUF2141 family)|nr:DUF2141 domain-containing protein [Reyranella sp.]
MRLHIEKYTIRTIVFAIATGAMAHGALAADLTVKLSGAKSAEGLLVAGVFNSKEAFPKEGQQIAAFRGKPVAGGGSVTFHDLPPGRYAITAFHDENGNGKLDRDATGIPQEGYGVSNDARELLSPPFWDKASFELGSEAKTVTIKIEY